MQDTETKMPTNKGQAAILLGQRLAQANRHLQPADIARLANEGASNASALDFEVLERPDGSRYQRQVLIHNGKQFSLGESSATEKASQKKESPAPVKPSPKPAPKPTQAAPVQVPTQKAGLSLMSEAQASQEPAQPREKISQQDAYKMMEQDRNARRLKNQSARAKEAEAKSNKSNERKLKMEQRAKEIQALNAAQGRRN